MAARSTTSTAHDPATCRNGDHYGQCSGPTAMGTASTTGTSRLTDADRRVQGRARALVAAAKEGQDALREHTGEHVYPTHAAFGEAAHYVIPELIAIIERLDAPAPVAGYLVDGKAWHPEDVTIVRETPSSQD